MDKLKTLLYILLFTNLINCQEMKKIPEFHVEICHPSDKYLVEFVSDKIKTLEGVPAGLPFGGTSGKWGFSGKGWTEQHGTPIGADIIYFSVYEDTFYHLDVDFPKDTIEKYMTRAYAKYEATFHNEPLQEYKNLGRDIRADATERPYNSFSNLVFGFAPKGVVVVWLRFGYVQIELGRYQAKTIEDDKLYEEKLFASWSMNREQVKERSFIKDANPQQWDNYRQRYLYTPTFTSLNKGLKVFEMGVEFYNGERELFLQPWIENPQPKNRAIPKEIYFFWETGKNEKFEGRAFFNWEDANEAFQNLSTNQNNLEFRIREDNSSFEILLNGKPFPTDSTRVYSSDFSFKNSYR